MTFSRANALGFFVAAEVCGKTDEPISKNIVINEAVELAKRYGTDDSGRFVNGILETISK